MLDAWACTFFAGSVAEWLAALGTLGAVIVALSIAGADARRRQRERRAITFQQRRDMGYSLLALMVPAAEHFAAADTEFKGAAERTPETTAIIKKGWQELEASLPKAWSLLPAIAQMDAAAVRHLTNLESAYRHFAPDSPTALASDRMFGSNMRIASDDGIGIRRLRSALESAVGHFHQMVDGL